MKEKLLKFFGIQKIINRVNKVTTEGAEAVQDRMLLAKIELQEEIAFAKKRFWHFVLCVGFLVNLVPILLFSFILLFWDTSYRQWIIGGVMLGWLALSLFMLVYFVKNKRRQLPFEALRAELGKDLAGFKVMLRKDANEKEEC